MLVYFNACCVGLFDSKTIESSFVHFFWGLLNHAIRTSDFSGLSNKYFLKFYEIIYVTMFDVNYVHYAQHQMGHTTNSDANSVHYAQYHSCRCLLFHMSCFYE